LNQKDLYSNSNHLDKTSAIFNQMMLSILNLFTLVTWTRKVQKNLFIRFVEV